MPDAITNPIINSPFEQPQRHYRFTEIGITNEIQFGRRESVYFVPLAKLKSQSGTAAANEYRSNQLINEIRQRVARWREQGYPQVTRLTHRLLEYWNDSRRERRLFFCQLEAIETAIYLTEIATHDANQGTYILQRLIEANQQATPINRSILNRQAMKMATGSGKTVVMAMIIAWHTLNKVANKTDKRFSDAFLIVTPGITIKDRLRVLLPNDAENYYRQLDLVPATYLNELGKAKIYITNYHAFQLRERTEIPTFTKKILLLGKERHWFKETESEMVRRISKELGVKRQIIVINDEAHHCYHQQPNQWLAEKLIGDERKAAEERELEAKTWISGLEAIERQMGIKVVYDLTATPFFLRGSGYEEGTLFPWVISDFSLADAIESGIVKVPRFPVAPEHDEGRKYRHLWKYISSALPRSRHQKLLENQEVTLPELLTKALFTLYDCYVKSYQHWQNQIVQGYDNTPPVFIIVCGNTKISKLVFDWIAGYPLIRDGQTVLVPGKLAIFSNVAHGEWLTRPNTILVDSQQLESGEALSEEFMRIAAEEIKEFKVAMRERFNHNVDNITPAEILREVMNTVGKKGKLGESIKCVVSVAMLTEGWDTNTVTHIMGIRAFSTQLLCEQVVGRGLRRTSYETFPHTIEVNGEVYQFEALPIEYADVYGVPFEFIPIAMGNPHNQLPKKTTQVSTIEERTSAKITFPRLQGYRHQWEVESIQAIFTETSHIRLTNRDIPINLNNMPILGEAKIHNLQQLKQRRLNEVAFLLAKLVMEKYFRQDGRILEQVQQYFFDKQVRVWLFPQVLQVTKRWLNDGYVICQDDTFPQLLLLITLAHQAVERIYQAIIAKPLANPFLMPILHTVGTTEGISFQTTKEVYVTSSKCHLSHVVIDSQWERQLVPLLENMSQVKAYVKNYGRLEFYLPYSWQGQEHRYRPDFIIKLDDGEPNWLNLLLKMAHEPLIEANARLAVIEKLWIAAVNNSKRFGRWACCEIREPSAIAVTLAKYGVKN
jgi:type III restriction enzyme